MSQCRLGSKRQGREGRARGWTEMSQTFAFLSYYRPGRLPPIIAPDDSHQLSPRTTPTNRPCRRQLPYHRCPYAGAAPLDGTEAGQTQAEAAGPAPDRVRRRRQAGPTNSDAERIT